MFRVVTWHCIMIVHRLCRHFGGLEDILRSCLGAERLSVERAMELSLCAESVVIPRSHVLHNRTGIRKLDYRVSELADMCQR